MTWERICLASEAPNAEPPRKEGLVHPSGSNLFGF